MKRVHGLYLIGSALAFGVGLASLCSGAAAQVIAVRPGDDLRPVYASSSDIAEGRRLAVASCGGCHGINGISPNDGVPHLAGQRPAYLYIELKAYQTGARDDGAMSDSVKFLSDDALVKVAAYFSSLDPIPPLATRPGPAKPDPVQAGKAAAASCGGCHGDTGISKIPGMPSLVGLDPKYLVTAMKAYKTGQRKHDMMKSMLAKSSDVDISNMALHYAVQKAGRAQTPVSGDAVAGQAAAEGCAGCHGDRGVSGSPVTPSLAGQDAQYFVAALKAYKDGSRQDETMKALASGLDDNAAKNLAAFYAGQEPQAPTFRKPLTTEELVQRCDRCHGPSGNSIDPRLPALAGQRADYLQKALQGYRGRTRKSSEMAAMSDGLSDEDIENLAAHYTRQRARGAVYITVPSK